MNPARLRLLVCCWFLALGSVALLVAVTPGPGGVAAAPAEALIAAVLGLAALLAGAGLWWRRRWARALGVLVSLALAAAKLGVLPVAMVLDALVLWLLLGPGSREAFAPPPGPEPPAPERPGPEPPGPEPPG